ncbi:unnamed protein product [Ectocarpus sp. 6 AP-2014]
MTSGDFCSRAPRRLIRPTDPPQPNGRNPLVLGDAIQSKK